MVITGTGFTVAITSNVGPGQPLDEGVILYVTVPLVKPLVLDNTCEITFPDPGKAPVTFVLPNTTHENVVPVTEFGFVISILLDCPEQIVCGDAEAVGTGRTVTTKFTGIPLHPETTGVML